MSYLKLHLAFHLQRSIIFSFLNWQCIFVHRKLKCNLKNSLQKEIIGLKKLPTLKLRKELRQYKLLLKFNTELFWFCFSLVCCFFPLLFFKFSIITSTLALLYHYFFAWKKANPIIDGKHQLETEREEVSLIIEEIHLELRQREEVGV